MRYLHTMLRVRNLDAALDFYCNRLGLKEVRRRVDDKGRYTLVFLAAPEDATLAASATRSRPSGARSVELTYNWDTEDYGEARYFGHLAYEVDDIYAFCERLMKGRRHHQPAAARRSSWRSCARPTSIRSSSCRRATRCRRRSPGRRCPIPASGETSSRRTHSGSEPGRRAFDGLGLLPVGKALYTSPRLRALRLAVQDAALSRRKHGFDSRRARQGGPWEASAAPPRAGGR